MVCEEHVGRRAKTKAYYDNLLAGTYPLSMSPEQFAYTRPSGHHLDSYWGYGEVLEGSHHAHMSLVKRSRTHTSIAKTSAPEDQKALKQQQHSLVTFLLQEPI